MQTKTFGTLIGSYGKGVAGSATVNFTTSGGSHCDDSCPLKGNGCYAITTEAMKPSITINLERKQEHFSEYLQALTTPKAITKLQQAPWVRFAAFGSIPAPYLWSLEDFSNLRTLGKTLDHTKVHFPTETLDKADLLKVAGFMPRVSVATKVENLTKVLAAGHVASCAVKGDKLARGKNKRSHSAHAITFVRDLRSQGINAKVCPAVAGNAKCGSCTACADPAVQVIVYPMH